jgi:poly(ribitol-phosphate) beta-N-acetylglucosaminyltransferase
MHKSCVHIQKSIYLAPNEIRACCQRFFVDKKIKGDVKLLSVNEPRDIDFHEVIESKENLVKNINNGSDDRCSGCLLLEEKNWPEIKNEKLNVISIENHSQCNMKCTYCSDAYYGGVVPQYSLPHLFKNVDEVSDDLHIAWGGGEPTIRKDFNDLFLSINAKFRPKTQRVFTNALKYSKALQEAIDDRSTSITTSIDAGNEETFRKIRDSRGLDRVLKFLGRYAKNNPDLVTIKYIFTEDNYDNENLSQFVEKIKSNHLLDCNFLISANFYYGTLSDEIIIAIISLYFKLQFEGVNALSFDDHIYHKVRTIGSNVSYYLDSLVTSRANKKTVKEYLELKKNRSNNKIVIWGTGEFSKYLLSTMKEGQNEILAIVDGFEDKKGTDFMGFKVHSPTFLLENQSDIVIASANFYGEIYNKITSLGISKDRIIPNFLL